MKCQASFPFPLCPGDLLYVVAAREPSQYVIALSYVWAPSNNENTAYRLRHDGDNKTFLLPENLPLVVTDAISVTKSLGFQYLWIDKFCIAQRQPEVKHRQIAQMDAVYANSELTIIAAAGQGESHGLPGVSGRSRAVTTAAEIGESRVLWFQNPQALVRQSKWYTRGWTYQEAFLARRRLVFLDDQTYFECGTAEHREMILRPPSVRPFEHWEDEKTGLWSNTKGNYGYELFGYLDGILGEYTARELRYDSDSLLALVGVLHHLRMAPLGLRHVWGIPWDVIAPDDGGTRKDYSACDIFVAGLCWNHVRAVGRAQGSPDEGPRPCLPYPRLPYPRLGRPSLVVMRPRQFWLEDQHGNGTAVGTVAESNLSELFRHRILFIETWAASPDKIHFQEMPTAQSVGTCTATRRDGCACQRERIPRPSWQKS
ncbi:heterokaryon incompatibility protein-domain-containing protein [Xylariaceae sp. FL0662B]|nr:heterokaryon incompatibility protein-domain-containing protein [Xylariaceae sp. FL0662B]